MVGIMLRIFACFLSQPLLYLRQGHVAELVYAQHSKCCERKLVWVRVPPCPPMGKKKVPVKSFSWTPELAYVVGLLVTDGNLSRDGRHIIMTSKDREQIETFLRCIERKVLIGLNHNAHGAVFRAQIGDVELYRWLEQIGVTANKTHTVRSIHIPDVYFIDFLRGHLDGDGSITTYIDRYNMRKNQKYIYRRVWVRFLSASKPHLVWLREKIISLLRVQGRLHTIQPRDDKRVPLYVLKFGKKESLHILKTVYYAPNIPALSRKRMTAEKILKQFA